LIFIDAGAFIARYLKRDQYHQAVVSQWALLAADERPCVTTNFVIDETITFLARRSTCNFAAARAEAIYSPNELRIICPEAQDELSALELLRKYSDQTVSFTDCVSCAIMDKLRISTAFAFDHDFRIAGFDVVPET